MEPILFKVAFSIHDSPEPYHLHVAVPDGLGRFIAYEYKFSDKTNCTLLGMDYFTEYCKRPDSILQFHKDSVAKRDSNLELPFAKY